MKTYRFDKYVQEAAVPPFVLEVSDDEKIEIPAPSTETVLLLEESSSSRERLRLLTGPAADRVMELVSAQPMHVMSGLAMDIARHFGVDMAQAPVGGFGASSS